MSMKTRNTWGSSIGSDAQGVGIDQQRSDLFRVSLTLPSRLGGAGQWDENVQFAVEAFPFPEYKVQTFDTKYLNQTNHQIGADNANSPIVVPVRYAFSQQTAALLYKWMYLISNPLSGGVGLTSAVKCNGLFSWLVPNMTRQFSDANSLTGSDGSDVLAIGLRYKLEGCFISGLKPTDADMKTGNSGVNLSFDLHIDRYYPDPSNPNDLVIKTT
jgi:hypothetical protein